MPNGFRALIESQYGSELFVTSITGEHVRLYPMAVWLEIERKLAAVPSTNPSKLRFLDRVNFFGQVATLDRQGRVVIPQILRESAAMAGDVSVLGLGITSRSGTEARLQREAVQEGPLHRGGRPRPLGARDLMWRRPRPGPARRDPGASRRETRRPLRRRDRGPRRATPRRSCAAARPTADCSAPTATPRRSRRPAPPSRRSATGPASFTRTSATSRRSSARRGAERDPPRSRRQLRPARRRRSGASASARTVRSTCAWTGPRGETAAELVKRRPRARPGRPHPRVRRGARVAADRPGDRRPRDAAADHLHHWSSPTSCGALPGAAAVAASTRRLARSRPCASRRTASSTGSARP